MALISNKDNNMYSELKKCINNAEEIYMNVSFIRDSGLKLLIEDLRKAKEQGKKIKILTSDYMQVTEPNALYRLLDFDGVKIFDNKEHISFHSKAYMFKYKDNSADVFIGSSNISKSALITGVEWNENINGKLENENIKSVLEEFDFLYKNNSFDLDLEWLRKYGNEYRVNKNNPFIKQDIENKTPDTFKIEPINFQIPALYELSKTREEGYNKALIIVGTGLGKTFLSVFDSKEFKRVLFIAHREEILSQSRKSFEKFYKNKRTYGFFKGDIKEKDKDIIFASIFTIGKEEYLKEEVFPKDYFDYIVIDEVHHGVAKSYQNVLSYFKPKFLLGLTATPERMDSGDVYKICDYNIAYECDFRVGINNGWLVPFEYFGIYDDVNYETIPWKNGKYDLEKLENALIVEERTENIFLKYINFRKSSSIGFCASVKHAKYMCEYFRKKSIKAEIIIGDTPSSERKRIIKNFEEGKLEIIFTVDIFNEGVDIPRIDTVLFLRPTESYTIFIQQLGRGLRLFEGKKKLRILDFVGNYKGADLKPLFLTGNYKTKEKILPIDDDFILPEGCSANFDFKLIDYLAEKRIQSVKISLKENLKNEYIRIKEVLEKVPTINDIYSFGEYPINSYIKEFGSWNNFLKEMGDLNFDMELAPDYIMNFLNYLEKTKMTKAYKMVLFLGLFEEGIKESISLEEFSIFFKNFYSYERYGKDLADKKHLDYKDWELSKWETLIRNYPIKYICEEKDGAKYFEYDKENKMFSLNPILYKKLREHKNISEAILDRVNYRISNFFSRKYNIKK